MALLTTDESGEEEIDGSVNMEAKYDWGREHAKANGTL